MLGNWAYAVTHSDRSQATTALVLGHCHLRRPSQLSQWHDLQQTAVDFPVAIPSRRIYEAFGATSCTSLGVHTNGLYVHVYLHVRLSAVFAVPRRPLQHLRTA